MNSKSKELKTAVVLATHSIGLGIIRALGKYGVPIVAIYYQKQDMGYVSKYVKEKVPAPHPEKSEKQFIDLLIDCAKRYPDAILIPADDATLVTVSKHKALLSNYYIVACAEWEITKRIIDKKYTYELAESLGIPAPKTIVPQNEADVKKYAESVNYPCLVKPRQSHKYFEVFGIKMRKVENADELLSAYNEAFQAGMEVLLQEYIPGEDSAGVNYNSYFWNNDPLVEFTAQKVRVAPPEFGVPAVVVSKHIPEILTPGRRILQALGYNGYSCTEFKKDARDGVYKLMEINGRYNRSLLLSVKCGINFPLIEYEHKIRGKIPSAINYKEGMYWIDEAKDFSAGIKYKKKAKSSLIHYLKPYFKPHIFAVLDIKDPMPFVKRCFDILGMVWAAVFKSGKSAQQSEKTKKYYAEKTREKRCSSA
jgi:predicted ATP-grasp superfamily ATP-dependent carboligase